MSIKISKQETINFNKLNNDPLISKETFSTENEIPAISTSAGRRNLRALENETRILSHALIESEPILQNIELYRNNPIGWPPLHYAISQGDIPAALEMIRLEPQQAFLFAPLKDMPYQTHKGAQSAQQILEKGLDATLKNFLRGPSALSLAIQNGSDVLVSALLELGVDIDAAHMRIDSVVNKLEENAHAYSNVVTAKLHTPLSLAIESKNLGLVQLLVKRGAPLTNLSQIVKVRAFRYYYQKVLDRFTQIDLARHSVFTLSKASRKLLFFFIAHQMKVDEDEVPEKFLSLYQKYSDHAQDFPLISGDFSRRSGCFFLISRSRRKSKPKIFDEKFERAIPKKCIRSCCRTPESILFADFAYSLKTCRKQSRRSVAARPGNHSKTV